MEWQRAVYASDVIQKIPGVAVVGDGPRAKVIVDRGPNKGCPVPIIINGSAGYFSINDVVAPEIGTMAVYRAGDMGPVEFDHGCGAILIWTKR
jgi:hypothetical protein